MGIYGQMSFGTGQTQRQMGEPQIQQQMAGIGGAGNFLKSVLMGQMGNLPMMSSQQATAQLTCNLSCCRYAYSERSLKQERNRRFKTLAPILEEVVGRPPIRSFRKNALISSTKKKNDNDDMVDLGLGSGTGSGSLFVKVSMDGAPYLRKVDLKTWSNYTQLSSALKDMFSSFTFGRDGLNRSSLKDINGSEYVLTFKDKMVIGCLLVMFLKSKFLW